MAARYANLTDFASAIEQNPDLKNQLVTDPVNTLRSMQGPLPDTGVYRTLIFMLGIAVLIALIGPMILAGFGKEAAVPQGVIALGSTAVGALAGILAPSPSQRGGTN